MVSLTTFLFSLTTNMTSFYQSLFTKDHTNWENWRIVFYQLRHALILGGKLTSIQLKLHFFSNYLKMITKYGFTTHRIKKGSQYWIQRTIKSKNHGYVFFRFKIFQLIVVFQNCTVIWNLKDELSFRAKLGSQASIVISRKG